MNYIISLVIIAALSISGIINKEITFVDPLISHRDTTVSAAEDFFLYANGGWFKENPISPSDRSNGIFNTIGDTINSQIKQICERSAADTQAALGSNKQKIGDFYASGMDTVSIEKAGLTPINSEMKAIEKISDVTSLLTSIAHLQTIGASPAFSFYISQDDKISSKQAAFFRQGGLGLGDRDYYFLNDPRTKTIRKEYENHLKSMMRFIGDNEETAAKNASVIMKLEMDLAKSSRKLEALRDPLGNYHKMSISKFNKLTPAISWSLILKTMGLTQVDSVIVGQPEFFTSLNKLIKKYTISEWKTYLKWDLINSYSSFLNKDIRDQNFKFFATVMGGVSQQKPRWEGVVNQTDGALGDLIGQVYVAEYLPKGSKEKLMEIGTNIRNVFADHIEKLDWMSAVTKKKALHKLSTMIMKVGYPDKWKDLSELKIDRKSYCSNVLAANIWAHREMINKFGKPVDRNAWDMQPHTYNAYYNPSNNEIVVPACNIIVPGFEGRMPDDAILYSIIGGSTFGHEMTHGFDDQGCQYDEIGNLNNWWTKDDLKKFRAKTKLIVNQFNQFSVLGDKKVNGDATQGENIADLGGIVMGLEAFKNTAQFKSNQKISGLSPIRRFFLGYAYAWMVNINDESLANQIMTDVHAPAKFRINGPLSNMMEFYEEFNIKEGHKMFLAPSKRVVIW